MEANTPMPANIAESQPASTSSLWLRIKALLVHLVCSAVAAVLAIYVVFGLWYPAPLHSALGVTSIFLLLLAVDVTIGPLLTFVVYDKTKKTLKLDLAIIACVQIAALGYGIWTVSQGRPAWLVFNVDRFDAITVVDIDQTNLAQAPLEYRSASWTGPRWAAAAPPKDSAARNDLTWQAILGGADFPQRPDLYQPLAHQMDLISQSLHSIDELKRYNSRESLAAALQRWPEADAWLPLMARAKPMTVLMQKETGEVVAIVDLRPWN